jgi:hypothetical protein
LITGEKMSALISLSRPDSAYVPKSKANLPPPDQDVSGMRIGMKPVFENLQEINVHQSPGSSWGL